MIFDIIVHMIDDITECDVIDDIMGSDAIDHVISGDAIDHVIYDIIFADVSKKSNFLNFGIRMASLSSIFMKFGM